MGLGYKIFGYSLILPRFLISIFGLLALYFTYLSGERLYNSTIGLLSSLLLFLSPIFFAQCGLFHDVIPLTFFTISTFFYYISKSRLKFVFFSIGLILIKEVGIVVIISMLLVEIVKFVLGKEVKIKDVSCLFPSLVIFCIWIYLNKIKKHYFIRPDYIKWYLDAPFSPKFLWITFYNIFWKDYRFILLLGIIFAFFLSLFNEKLRKEFIREEFLIFLILIGILLLMAGLMGAGEGYAPLPRYFIFLYPFYFIFGVASLKSLVRKPSIFYIITVGIGFLFITRWYPEEFEWNGELNMTHQYMITLHKKAAEFIEKMYPNAVIVTVWPFTETVNDPKHGYVKRKYKVIGVKKNYDKNLGTSLKDKLRMERDKKIIAVLPSRRDDFSSLELDKYVKQEGKLVKAFERKCKYEDLKIEIYELLLGL